MPAGEREEIRAVVLDWGGVIRKTKLALVEPVEAALREISIDPGRLGLNVAVFYKFRQLRRFEGARDAIPALYAIHHGSKQKLEAVLDRPDAVSHILHLMALHPIPLEELDRAHAKHSEVLNRVKADLPPVEGSLEAIHRLRRMGLRLAILTNESGRGAREWLRRHGLEKHFERIIGKEDVTELKPHPEGMKHLLYHFQARPYHVIMVGDQPKDMEAGKNARVRHVVGVLTGASLPSALEKAGAHSVHPNLKAFVAFLEARRRGKKGQYFKL